jgi:hypothetical protein
MFFSASLSGNMGYLEMTLGQVPNEDDDLEAWSNNHFNALEKLCTNHDFEHLDSSHGRNNILVGGYPTGYRKTACD